MKNFKDESFIAQYLSPKLMRDFRLFAVLDDDHLPKLRISAIHDERGYRAIREGLSEQYNLGNREPDIQVWDVDVRGDRSLTLRHLQHHRRPLADNLDQMLTHVTRLWGFNVRLETVFDDGRVAMTRERAAEKRRSGR
ncbi:MAG TPA: SpoVR family protein, partial [Rhodocyclaceae bacterium]|nr:SpoVR family protein [Rhodocyclaceae bacterium]